MFKKRLIMKSVTQIKKSGESFFISMLCSIVL